jgi:glycosyltransferase involved in cell wall biosynthesis
MIDKLPRISIITVCYNSSSSIEKTIKSVFAQNYPNLEYIFVDGNSSDNTLEIIKKYQKDENLITSEKDNGPFDAMNKGIQKASGDLIGIINADDWYEKSIFHCIAKAFLANNQPDVISGNMQYWDGADRGKLSFAVLDRITKEMSLNHPTIFVKKSTYIKHGIFDLQYKLASDYELVLRFYTLGCKFFVLNKIVANMSLEGMSDKQWKTSLKEAFHIKLKYTSKLIAYLEYAEVYSKETTVRQLKKYNLYGLYKRYKNFSGILSGKGKRF